MRVLVIDESAERAGLLKTMEEMRPEVVVMDADVVLGLLQEIQSLRAQLAERKLVERARGLLMKSRGLDEEAAYAALRKMAMDRKLRLGEVAQRVVDAARLLSSGTEP
jgi:response regulator NasT